MRARVVILMAAATVAVGLTGPITPSTAATAKTTIRFVISGSCEGCQIGAQRALGQGSTARPSRPQYWESKQATVRNGVAVLVVPTAATQGMSFTLMAPWESDDVGARSNIVLRSKGRSIGARVSASQAKKTRLATACWAGTRSSGVRIKVSVTPVIVQGYTGPATAALAWTSPTVKTIGPWHKTYHGILANQDSFIC